MGRGIHDIMQHKGYKFLASGADQDTYLAPDGSILKIFGWEKDTEDDDLSYGQQSFVDFASYCQDHPNNPFLPNFGGWHPFTYKGQNYLQIKCERLFEFPDYDMSEALSDLADEVKENGPEGAVKNFMHYAKHGNPYGLHELILLLGGQRQLKLLAKTIADLNELADVNGYRLDLHSGNFMLGSDGTVVINDPFFTGGWRSERSGPGRDEYDRSDRSSDEANSDEEDDSALYVQQQNKRKQSGPNLRKFIRQQDSDDSAFTTFVPPKSSKSDKQSNRKSEKLDNLVSA